MLKELMTKNRSCRCFKPTPAVELKQLEEIIDIARLSASGGNLQPLKYVLCCDAETNEKVYPTLRWAGYLKNWNGPAESERPTGYIVILRDNEITSNSIIDHGLAIQAMSLAATEMGLGSCIVGSIDRDRVREIFDISRRYEILLVLSLGTPGETSVIETAENGEIQYWRDDQNVHHVPKRSLDDVIIGWKQ